MSATSPICAIFSTLTMFRAADKGFRIGSTAGGGASAGLKRAPIFDGLCARPDSAFDPNSRNQESDGESAAAAPVRVRAGGGDSRLCVVALVNPVAFVMGRAVHALSARASRRRSDADGRKDWTPSWPGQNTSGHDHSSFWSRAACALGSSAPENPMIRTVRVVVSGRVQGVGFAIGRSGSPRSRAFRAGCATVTTVGRGAALGEAGAVEAMVEACRTGPRWATVDNVTVVDAVADPGLQGFRAIAGD